MHYAFRPESIVMQLGWSVVEVVVAGQPVQLAGRDLIAPPICQPGEQIRVRVCSMINDSEDEDADRVTVIGGIRGLAGFTADEYQRHTGQPLHTRTT